MRAGPGVHPVGLGDFLSTVRIIGRLRKPDCITVTSSAAKAACSAMRSMGSVIEIRGGLPFVAPGTVAPVGMEILALGLSSTVEEGIRSTRAEHF